MRTCAVDLFGIGVIQKDTVVYLNFSLGVHQISHHPLLLHSFIIIPNLFQHLYICIGIYDSGTAYAYVYMHMAVRYVNPLIGESRETGCLILDQVNLEDYTNEH